MTYNAIDIKEQLDVNLSSRTIEQILDYFLYSSVKPVFLETDLMDGILSSILVQQTYDGRRKISSLNKQDIFDLILKSINVNNKIDKWKYFKSIKIERTLLVYSIEYFLNSTKNYLQLEEKLIKTKNTDRTIFLSGEMYRIEQFVGGSRNNLSTVIKDARFNLDMYFNFKNMILEKYIRYFWTEAKNSKNSTNLNVDENELFNNFVINADKAIDKFDSDRGTLTSYINNWLKDAKTNPKFGHEYGNSFSVSSTGRRSIMNNKENGNYFNSNISTSIDELVNVIPDERNIEDELGEKQEREKNTAIIQKVNKSRIPMIVLDIPYKFSKNDIEWLSNN